MQELWRRYRAFGEGLDTVAEIQSWIPRGAFESEGNYAHRIRLAKDLGVSPSALQRINGALFRGAVTRDYAQTDAVLGDALREFDARAGGSGVSIDELLDIGSREALMMGVSYYFVGREATPNAVTAADESIPFVERYDAEELINWDVDTGGSLLWAVLRRVVSRQATPNDERHDVTIWRVLTPMTSATFEARADGDLPTQTSFVGHGLGRVPLARHFGLRNGAMQGRSYIDALSRADHSRLQLSTDQNFAAFMHANPRLMLRSTRPVDQISADGGRVLVLNPDANETAEYVALDATGLDVMSKMIEAVTRQGATLAGMDPTSFATLGDPKARSGAAMAYSFTSAEAPTLEKAFASLLAVDLEIHELVARYYLPRNTEPPRDQVFKGSITRAKAWDVLALDELVDVATTMWDKTPSPTWRREVVRQVATRAPGNLPPALVEQIGKELDAAAFADEPPPDEIDPVTGAPVR